MITLQIGAFTDTLEVQGNVPALNPSSSTTGRNLDTDLLDGALPLVHDTTQLAYLVPGTVPGDSNFQPSARAVKAEQTGCTMCGWGTPGQALLSFEGASVAENLYVVDGLNITNFSQGLGSTFIPLEFVDEMQVKNGGLTAEFGRTTGGVVNMITKSGSNRFRGDVRFWWAPDSLQEMPPDTLYRTHQDESRESFETTASFGGPLIRDRLFFFLFLRHLDADSTEIHRDATEAGLLGISPRAYDYEQSSPYWGGKLDFNLATGHRLSGTYISDSTNVDVVRYGLDLESGSFSDPVSGTKERGGDNIILRYTGVLGEHFMLTAQAGVNLFDRYDQSDRDDCPYVTHVRSGAETGCWVVEEIVTWKDRRNAFRIDADWFVGRHAFRAGIDHEQTVSDASIGPSGGVHYHYTYNYLIQPPRWPELPFNTELVEVTEWTHEGQVETESSAAYIQDSWTPTSNLTFNLGLRWEGYDHRNAAGDPFLEINDGFSPRIGFAWDPSGRGQSKIYGSFGRYYLPYPTNAAVDLGTRWYERERVYVLAGEILEDGSPANLGDPIADDVLWDGDAGDPQWYSANSIEPITQNGFVLGFQHSIGDHWTVQVRGARRELLETIEDFSIAQGLWDVYGVCNPNAGCNELMYGNPGRDFSGWFDFDDDGVLDPIYITAEQNGMPEPERTYSSVEISAERRFAGSWMLFAAYTWSLSQGNYEGLVNSDFDDTMSGFNSAFDNPLYLEHATGDLPNDRRHFLRFYGAYAFRNGFNIGGAFSYRTGRAVNSFGFHPANPDLVPYAFFTGGEPRPRGSMGRTEDVWSLDLTLKYSWPIGGTTLDVRVDVFNLFDNQAVVEVEEQGEYWDDYRNGIYSNEDYGKPTSYQRPRSVRIGLGVSF